MYRNLARRPLWAAAAAAATVVAIEEDKLSIYPSPSKDIILVQDPLILEEPIGKTRRAVLQSYREGYASVHNVVDGWIGIEQKVESRIKALLPPDEPIVPGILYTGVATLSGSILARNRSLPTRALLPPLFLVASAGYFLPKTSANVSAYFGELEETYAPRVARFHETGKAHSAMGIQMAQDWMATQRGVVFEGVVGAVDKVQAWTGLKIREAVGLKDSRDQKKKDE